MAKFFLNNEMKFTVTIQLDEEEARALESLTYYGFTEFFDVYHNHLGSNIDKHIGGLRSLFADIENDLPKQLKKIDNARLSFK
jgi:hypothetical protein